MVLPRALCHHLAECFTIVMESTRALNQPDGTRLTYSLTISRSIAPERAVVLVHGLASNRSRWAEFVEQTSLGARWSMIRLDLRGHGDSQARGGISLEKWCADIAAVLEAEHHAQAVVVGHSLGAQVALQFAVQFPHLTKGIVLIDPVFRDALRNPLPAWLAPLFRLTATVLRALNAIGLRRRHIEPLNLRALDDEARVALRTAESTEAFVKRYSSPCADMKHIRAANYFQDLVEMFRRIKPGVALKAPVLLVLSSGATFADPARTHEIASQWTTPTVVKIEAEHWPLTEKPVEIRQAIEAWVERLT
jgi:esterase